ncbi:MAG: lectin like domain-containing protein, partial [Clostridiales Family XIII bacterium]|nr:lectin like domain-containing protein [Clostridiales Family XIII bacterium]
TYARTNFAPATPPGDGAFLIKNSWGSTAGSGGYFWLSYYEGSIENSYYFSLGDDAADTILYTDDLGNGSFFGYPGAPWDMMANVFTLPAGDPTRRIDEVTIYASTPGNTYTVSLYKNPSEQGNPQSGRQIDVNADATLTSAVWQADYAGYRTIALSQPAVVRGGDTLAVVVRVDKKSADDMPIPLEVSQNGTSLLSAGQSYYIDGYGAWADLTSSEVQNLFGGSVYGNLNIRAVGSGTTLLSLTPEQTEVTVAKGQSLDADNLFLTAVYANGLTERIPLSEQGLAVTGIDTKKLGLQTATATLDGVSATFTVKVVTGIRTPLSTVYLKSGSSLALPVVNELAPQKLTFKSSSKKVVKVSKTGKLTAAKNVTKKKKATVTIKASGGYQTKITVYVVPEARAVSKLSVSGMPKKLTAGATKQLKVKIGPSSATNVKVTFASSNKKVLAVDKAGLLTAKKAGTAKITVKAGGKTYSKTVKVTAP